MADWVPNYLIIKTQQTNLLLPFTLFSNLHTVHPLIHDQGWHLGLPANLGQPSDILALTPFRARVSVVSLLVCLKTSRFFIMQVRWLSFGGLLVNLSVLHHERMTSSLRSSIRGSPGIQCPCWCVIWTTSNVNTRFGDSAGKNLLQLYFVADSSCPSPTPHWSIFLSSPLPLHLAQKADRIWLWSCLQFCNVLHLILKNSARRSSSKSWSTKVVHHKTTTIIPR
jgi:hypothetical protein